jgi:ATP-binding cassette subfamily B protein
MTLPSLRQQWGSALQEPFLFSSSLRENISFHNSQLTDAEVIRAAEIAEIHSDIVQMPMGYETRIDEFGQSLSGGQRQRIAIARAVAGNPSLLLLDEATSHLDVLTERGVERNLDELACTRIVIAHRLSTIRNADLIVVLEDGAIVEQGSHQYLLSQGGLYMTLVNNQAAGLQEKLGEALTLYAIGGTPVLE